MHSWMSKAVLAAGLITLASPAHAGRTAIDSRPILDANGNPVFDEVTGNQLFETLIGRASGYCDFNGEDCGGTNLGYTVKIGGAEFNTVVVHGNGLLTFGQAVDFTSENSPVFANINDGLDPLITDYGRTLVSAGQRNEIDLQPNDGYVFTQSARIAVNAVTGVITTQFYYCGAPRLVNGCVDLNTRTLTLTPTAQGYEGAFDFSTGESVGYVIGDVFNSTGSTFRLPATFQGLAFASAVPEPATWAMMIGGFGMIGAAMRTRRRSTKVSFA